MVSISGIFFSQVDPIFQVQAVGISVHFSTRDGKPQGPPFPAEHSAFFGTSITEFHQRGCDSAASTSWSEKWLRDVLLVLDVTG